MYSLALVLEDLSLTEKKSRLHTVENLGAEDRERLDADKADLCSLTTMLEALCFPEEGPVVQTVKNLAPWDRKILDADHDALGSLSQVLEGLCITESTHAGTVPAVQMEVAQNEDCEMSDKEEDEDWVMSDASSDDDAEMSDAPPSPASSTTSVSSQGSDSSGAMDIDTDPATIAVIVPVSREKVME